MTRREATRTRGAPYAVPISPSTWRRVPGRGAAWPTGSSSSTAPEASWTIRRRPDASRSVAAIVTTASMRTGPSARRRTAAIGRTAGPAGRRRGRRRSARRCPGARSGNDDQVGRVADPESVAVERALARGALAHDARQPQPRAGPSERWLEAGGLRRARPEGHAGVVNEPQHEVAARLARRRRLERSLQYHQARLGGLAQRRRRSRQGIRQRLDPIDNHVSGGARPKLELTVRVDELPGHPDARAARRSRSTVRQLHDEAPGGVLDRDLLGQADPARLGRDDALDGHARVTAKGACRGDRRGSRWGRR